MKVLVDIYTFLGAEDGAGRGREAEEEEGVVRGEGREGGGKERVGNDGREGGRE